MIEIKDKETLGIKDLNLKGFLLLDDDFKIQKGEKIKDGEIKND